MIFILFYYFLEAQCPVLNLVCLYRFRRKRDKLVESAVAARIPTMWGPFNAYCFKSVLDGIEHIAMVKVRNVFHWDFGDLLGLCSFFLL